MYCSHRNWIDKEKGYQYKGRNMMDVEGALVPPGTLHQPATAASIGIGNELHDYSHQLIQLERQEMESGGDCSPQVYAQLLALYVYQEDLSNAALLWKRIPNEVKNESNDVTGIWSIGRCLIQSKYEDVYSLIREKNWPNYLSQIMMFLATKIKSKMINLISTSYSWITIEEVRSLTGSASLAEVTTLVNSLGWSVDPTNPSFIIPKRPTASAPSEELNEEDMVNGRTTLMKDTSQDQLRKLTEYVAFLENH